MALVARGVEGGSDINVLVDNTASGDVQIVKLGLSALGSTALVPATTADGMLVQVSNPAAVGAAVTSVIPGIGVTNLGKAEDDPAASGDTGVFALAVRRDAPTSGAAAGDYHELEVDALGRLWVSGTYAEDAAHASGDYGNFVLGVASLARTARSADGDYTPLAVGLAGEQFVSAVPEANSAWAASNYSALAAASGVIKAAAGKLLKVTLTNDNAAARYLQFFNLTAVPADTTAPLFAVKLAIGQTLELHWEPFGKYFSTGICWSNSTTGATKTIGAADSYVEATYL